MYEVDAEHLLLVASDRVSAFDVVMREPVPRKGAVLTQISAFWFERLAEVFPSHYITARTQRSWSGCPCWKASGSRSPGEPCWYAGPTRCRSSASCAAIFPAQPGREYNEPKTLAGEPLPPGLVESARLDPPLFSPATKAETGHDINVTFDTVGRRRSGSSWPAASGTRALRSIRRDATTRRRRGIIIADTKFEFGTDAEGKLRLIDELLTPDSSRFWPADQYAPGRPQPSFDKQPLRDYLASLKSRRAVERRSPAAPAAAEVVDATSRRYLEAYRLLTGQRSGARIRDPDRAGRPLVHRRRVGHCAGLIWLAAPRTGSAWWIACVLWFALAVWVVAFFRDPERTGQRGDRLILAPADGKVVSLVETDEPAFLRRPGAADLDFHERVRLSM